MDCDQAQFYGGTNLALAPKSAISPKDLRGFGGGAKMQEIKP